MSTNKLMRWAAAGAALGVARAAYRRWKMMDLAGKSVLIAGGSRGLGLELAREFGRRGARVTVLARDEAELDRARADLDGADTIRCDIRDPADVARAVSEADNGGIDVLVNVAGIIDVAPFEHLDIEDYEDSLATHFWGPLHLIRETVGRMPSGGRIINISSIGGLVAVPHLLSYAVGKFALTGLSAGLRAELSRRGIYVTTICPGLMRTGSHVRARFKGRQEAEFAWFAAGSGLPILSTGSKRAARRIVEACRLGEPFVILTPQAHILHLLNAVFPNTSARIMSVAARLLPGPEGGDGRRREGWQARSEAAPSLLTRLADRAIGPNNELPEGLLKTYFNGR